MTTSTKLLEQLLAQGLAERVGQADQERKRLGYRSKYVPHQGAREKATRLAKLAAMEKKSA